MHIHVLKDKIIVIKLYIYICYVYNMYMYLSGYQLVWKQKRRVQKMSPTQPKVRLFLGINFALFKQSLVIV